MNQLYTSDFLVIGSGIAGLTFAIKASSLGTVNIVTKKKNCDSNTNYAQGGIAGVVSPDDSFGIHLDDTLKAGAGLCNRKAVDILTKSGPERINELIGWGVRFTYKEDGNSRKLDLGREGGHTKNRIVHAMDFTGREVERALLAEIEKNANIKIFENHTLVDLLTEHQLGESPQEPSCFGAYILQNETGDVHRFISGNTFISTGGAGCVYLHTTNPSIATGDGIASAYRAGALVGDLEFMQFHPTSFYKKDNEERSLLISEAVRGEGAHLFNSKGERFMENIHPMKELAPRDIVARAIDHELKKSGDPCVFLDISFKDAEFLKTRFPFIYSQCLEEGIDITKQAIPVVPAAHYLCGGIITDVRGRTSIKNLYSAGESACTGVHGANRLASNSLLEAIVFAEAAFADIKKRGIKAIIPDFPEWSKEGTFDREEWILIEHNVDEIKRLMWDYVGIVRSNLRLQRAMRRISFLKEEIIDYYKRSTISLPLVELRNLATVAKLMINGAVNRKESRGLHYNTDYPDISGDMEVTIVQKAKSEDLTFNRLEDIIFEWK